eukprot:COSAG01_NODE_41667_length_448_cov_3.727794_1_plen_42_part_10
MHARREGRDSHTPVAALRNDLVVGGSSPTVATPQLTPPPPAP